MSARPLVKKTACKKTGVALFTADDGFIMFIMLALRHSL